MYYTLNANSDCHNFIVSSCYLNEIKRSRFRKSCFWKERKSGKVIKYVEFEFWSTSNDYNSYLRMIQVCYKISQERTLNYVFNSTEFAQFRVCMSEICHLKLSRSNKESLIRILEGYYCLFNTQVMKSIVSKLFGV